MKIIIAVRFEYVILACLFLFMFFSSVSKYYYPGLWGRHRRSMWSTAFNYKYVYFYEYVKYVKFEVIWTLESPILLPPILSPSSGSAPELHEHVYLPLRGRQWKVNIGDQAPRMIARLPRYSSRLCRIRPTYSSDACRFVFVFANDVYNSDDTVTLTFSVTAAKVSVTVSHHITRDIFHRICRWFVRQTACSISSLRVLLLWCLTVLQNVSNSFTVGAGGVRGVSVRLLSDGKGTHSTASSSYPSTHLTCSSR